MVQDSRYQAIGTLLSKGMITGISDMLLYVSKTKLQDDLGITHYGWEARMSNPGRFTVEEMERLADLIGCEYIEISKLVYEDYKRSRNRK